MLANDTMKYRVVVIIFFTLLLWNGIEVIAQTTPLRFSISNASVTKNDTFTVALKADSLLTGREVYSYRFYLTYNPSYLEFIDIDDIGSVLFDWGALSLNSSNAGTIVMVGAGSIPLEGTGQMVTLKFVAKTSTNTNISFNNIESYLNERNPQTIFTNGNISIALGSYPNIYPDNQNMFIGDVVQMSVSGGVAPYNYSVKNTGVAVITEQTKVQAVGAGATKVYVTDSKGEVSYTSGVFDVRVIRMDIEAVSAWPGDTFYLPLKIEIAPGTNVYSGNIKLSYSSQITGLS